MDDERETQRAQHLFCEESGCDSDAEARGWEGHMAYEDGSVTEAFSCPVCSIEV